MNEANKYPAVDAAYELSIETTKIAINRYDMQDGNLDKIITFIVSFNAATVAVLVSKTLNLVLDFHSCLFYLTIALFLSALISSFYGKFTTSIIIPNPMKLYEEHLWKSPYEFKMDHISYLGENFETIKKNTGRKWNAGRLALLLFTLELLFLSFWLIKGS